MAVVTEKRLLEPGRPENSIGGYDVAELANDRVLAEAFTAELVSDLENVMERIAMAFHAHIWVPMGLKNWTEYCDRYINLELVASRRDAAVALRMAGMSYRAIAAALGVNEATVVRDNADAGVAKCNTSDTVEVVEVTGQDGKTYNAPTAPAPDSAAMKNAAKKAAAKARKAEPKPEPEANPKDIIVGRRGTTLAKKAQTLAAELKKLAAELAEARNLSEWEEYMNVEVVTPITEAFDALDARWGV